MATVVRAGEKRLFVAGTLDGPLFVETDEGPQQAGRRRLRRVFEDRPDQPHDQRHGCLHLHGDDGATAWGEWDCAGYELVGCRGTFKLTGGTGRFEGASGRARFCGGRRRTSSRSSSTA